MTLHLVIHSTLRKVYPIVRLSDIIGVVLIMKNLINVATT